MKRTKIIELENGEVKITFPAGHPLACKWEKGKDFSRTYYVQTDLHPIQSVRHVYERLGETVDPEQDIEVRERLDWIGNSIYVFEDETLLDVIRREYRRAYQHVQY